LSKPFKLEELIQIAIKLTSSAADRYSSSENLSNKNLDYLTHDGLSSKISANECAIGRGGIALTVDTTSFKWDTGDLINFKLKFNDVELLGTAICRWWKPQEQANKATFGLEFVQLSDSTFDYFQGYWKDHSIVPFIPSLDQDN
jgi:hypothetical protein